MEQGRAWSKVENDMILSGIVYRRLGFLLLVFCALSDARPTSADTDTREIMAAASVVLSEALSTSGHIVMRSPVAASADEFNISFERVTKCTFAERFFTPDGLRFAVIDFSKLNGLYTFQKMSLGFFGTGRSYCIGTSPTRNHCYNGLVIDHPANRLEIKDAVYYILKHGCGRSSAVLLWAQPAPIYRISPASLAGGSVL